MHGRVTGLLNNAAQHFGRRTALISSDRSLTFTELNRLAENLGDGLRARGVRPGDRVVLWLGNGWRWVVAYYGVLSAGAVVVPANPLLAPEEVEFIARHCDATTVIAPCDELCRLTSRQRYSLVVSADSALAGAVEFEELVDSPNKLAEFEEGHAQVISDDAEICYTSGTTGQPKGVVLAHSSLITSARSMALVHGKTSTDVLCTALPCSHVYGTMVVNSAIAAGAALVLLPRLDERAVLAAIERYRVTVFEAVPAMYQALMSTRSLERFDVSSLRLCTVGGQAIAEARVEEIEARFSCALHELWGMTELAGPGSTHPYNSQRIAGSIGIPLPFTEMRIGDPLDPSRTFQIGQVGELLVRGPLVMKGYLNDAHATASSITLDGWLRTGDLVRRDDRGYLYLVDRLKDVILSGGYTLYPAEIERVISAFPAVALAAVVSADDDMRGEVAMAVVTLRPDMHCQPQDIIRHCRKHLATYKVPRKIEIVDTLPTGPTGKLLRRELRQRMARWGAGPSDKIH